MQITIREPGSALTHFIAMLLAAFAAAPLLTKAALYAGRESIIALSIFCVSMILLYGASATYHSLNLSGRPLRIFRKIDHMMIFILIAGSYTPVCLTVLGGKLGYTLLAVIWGLALFGMMLDHLSEMVFLCHLYCHGLGLCCRIRSTPSGTSHCCLPLAACRWHHLHHRRCDLRLKAPLIQCKA